MKAQNVIEQFLPENFYRKIARSNTGKIFYPVFSDRKAWEKIGRTGIKARLKTALIAEADELLEKPVEPLSTYDYFRFVLEGDRARFERSYFRRRNDFAAVAMAMCLSGDRKKYLPKIVDYLGAIIAELYWCNHAHAKHDADPMPPLNTAQRVDLFAAETAQQLALALQIFGAELAELSPRFARCCKETILHRVVFPVLKDTKDKPVHFWLKGTGNWTVWCAANVLTAAAVLLDDPSLLSALVKKLNESCAGYFEHFPADGYCDEGPGYWFKSPVEFFDYCRVLNTLLPGSAGKLFADPKFRRMGEFGALMVIAGRDQVVSADCGHIYSDGAAAGILYDYARATGSEQLENFAMKRIQPDPRRRLLTPEEEKVCRFGTGNRFSSLLDFFFKLPENPAAANGELPLASFWPDRMGIRRHPNGFSAALKAGCNSEKHNHNDLGHFTLYYQSRPLVIDLGTGMYSRRNFNSERYTLFYTNGYGHNALCFGGVAQPAGGEFTASLSMPDERTLQADLTAAFPAEAEVKKYLRTVECDERRVVLTDNFLLQKECPAGMTWYTPEAVKKQDVQTLDFGEGILCKLDGAVCEAIEPVQVAEIPRHWGSRLWKITLAGEKNNISCTFTVKNRKIKS